MLSYLFPLSRDCLNPCLWLGALSEHNRSHIRRQSEDSPNVFSISPLLPLGKEKQCSNTGGHHSGNFTQPKEKRCLDLSLVRFPMSLCIYFPGDKWIRYLSVQAASKGQVPTTASGDACMRIWLWRSLSKSLCTGRKIWCQEQMHKGKAGEETPSIAFVHFVSGLQWHVKGWKEVEHPRNESSRGLPTQAFPPTAATSQNHCKQNKVTHLILFRFCISSRAVAIFIRPGSPILLWAKL